MQHRLFFYHNGAVDAEKGKEKMSVDSSMEFVSYDIGYEDFKNNNYKKNTTISELNVKILEYLTNRIKDKK